MKSVKNLFGPGKEANNWARIKHHRNTLRDNIQGITNPSTRHLTDREGVKHVSGRIYDETRVLLEVFLENIILYAFTNTEHPKTVTAIIAIKSNMRLFEELLGNAMNVV